jgi:nucleotide-binding universal stress UspA family protein
LDIRKILVPVDFSGPSKRALDAAVGLAGKFGADLHLLHCCQLHPIGLGNEMLIPPSVDQTIQESASRLLAEWAGKAAGRGAVVHEHLSTGAPSGEIAALAEKLGADLIVMGTRGRSGLDHMLLGSVAERTIRIAPCPVLTVKLDAVAR